MVRQSIIRPNTVSIDGNEYKLKAPIRYELGPQFAPKVAIGDVNLEAHEGVSYLRWDDWTEGIGLEEFYSQGGEAPRRAWFSTCDTTNSKHLTLPPLATQTAQVTDQINNSEAFLPTLATFEGEIYACVRTSTGSSGPKIYKYNNGTDSWGSALHTFSVHMQAGTLDALVGTIGTDEYIVFGAGTSYAYSTDGSSWTEDSKDATRLAIHDKRLWGIDYLGNGWYATTPGTEIDIAALPVPSSTTNEMSHVTSLFEARDGSGALRLYAGTSTGLWVYDIPNDRWVRTDVRFPESKLNCFVAQSWNGDIYLTSGMQVFRVVFGAEQTTVVPIGLDRDHGLPAINRGAAIAGTSSINFLTVGTEITLSTQEQGFKHYLTDDTTFEGHVYGWDGSGWHVLWSGAEASVGVKFLHYSTAYDTYRLWAGVYNTDGATDKGHQIWYVDLPPERTNPDQVQTRTYASGSVHETPWFKVGTDVEGIALCVLAETKNPTSSETVQVEYEIDYSGSYTSFGTITTAGVQVYAFPDTTAPTGTSFNAIRFRITLARGGTNTNTPDLISLTFRFLKKLRRVTTLSMVLDISGHPGGVDPRNQWANLRTSMDKTSLLEVVYHDDNTAGSEDRFWMRVKNFTASVNTGLDYSGEAVITLEESQHLN